MHQSLHEQGYDRRQQSQNQAKFNPLLIVFVAKHVNPEQSTHPPDFLILVDHAFADGLQDVFGVDD